MRSVNPSHSFGIERSQRLVMFVIRREGGDVFHRAVSSERRDPSNDDGANKTTAVTTTISMPFCAPPSCAVHRENDYCLCPGMPRHAWPETLRNEHDNSGSQCAIRMLFLKIFFQLLRRNWPRQSAHRWNQRIFTIFVH